MRKSKIFCIRGKIVGKKLFDKESDCIFSLRNVLCKLSYEGFIQIRDNEDGTFSLLRTLMEGKGD
jgi:hypothetical protein